MMCIHVSCDSDVEELQTMKEISQAKTREIGDLQKLFEKSNNVYNCCFIPVFIIELSEEQDKVAIESERLHNGMILLLILIAI